MHRRYDVITWISVSKRLSLTYFKPTMFCFHFVVDALHIDNVYVLWLLSNPGIHFCHCCREALKSFTVSFLSAFNLVWYKISRSCCEKYVLIIQNCPYLKCRTCVNYMHLNILISGSTLKGEAQHVL